MDTFGRASGTPGPSPLRLAWHNPDRVAPDPAETAEPVRAPLRLVPPPAIPPRAVKLDLAIERHLTGGDGLTRDQFLMSFSGRASRGPVPALS